MSTSTPPFDFPSSLQEYAIPEKDYLDRHDDVHIICTGAVVFNKEGKLLLVQRAKEEAAFPDLWEIPGGKIDETDETILHGAARELKEETGLTATRVVRKVTQFTFPDGGRDRPTKTWLKLVFQFEADNLDAIALDPTEHRRFTWASEDEVVNDLVAEENISLKYISQESKDVKLEAFKLRREAAASA